MRSETGCKNCSSASTQFLTVWLQLPTHSVGDCFITFQPEGLGKSKRAYWQDERFAASILCFCGGEQVSKEFLNAYTLLSPWKKNHKTAEETLLCLYGQVFKVVKIAGCQVRTRTRKKIGESLQAHARTAKTRGGSIFFWIISILPNIDLPSRSSHLSKILFKIPKVQTLLKFLLMLNPKLIKGSLRFMQLSQKPLKKPNTNQQKNQTEKL